MKARPWDRPDVQVYWPEPVATIQYDPEQRKAVDPATGEFIIMRPGMRGGPGQFVFGDCDAGIKGSGGYTGDWYPHERISVTFINALTLHSQPAKRQSRSEFDAAPIARMIRAQSDAARAADPMHKKLQSHLPTPRIVVIDTRPESSVDAE